MSAITIRRVLPAVRERVFAAWTRPELMARWFFPAAGWSTQASCHLEVGGGYEVAMHDEAGGVHRQFGEYREITPVSRLVFTWTCPELDVEGSLVTIELHDLGGRTELVLTHELPPDERIRREHQGGWEGCLQTLERLLGTEGETR